MAATSSKSTSGAYEYEVFLSFRGPDSRLTFTDCLYDALVENGVIVFRDSEDLDYGDEIKELLRAVPSTEIFVAVLSKGYASSVWCLREIEHAADLNKSTGYPKILPIFLDVTAEDVKGRTALYRDALNKHRERHGDDQVGRWQEALKMAGKFIGWEAQGKPYSVLIKSVVGAILAMLHNKEKFVPDLVGIDERVNDITKLLDVTSKDVRFIGIHGMGGIGKTSLAKIIFNKLYSHFDKCSFVDDVRESMNKNGVIYLQKKLLRDLYNSSHVDNITSIDEGRRFIQRRAGSKKVLIVLDDMDKNEQLENLVGSLGLGSRVLITTRDKGIFSAVHGIITYEVHHLEDDQALELFSRHAFKADSPPSTHYDLSKQVVSKTEGLPLTLSTIGSHLHNKGEEIWRETLDVLNKALPEKVEDKLMISYNGLCENEKCIFLDIACFFNNKDKARAMDVWDACNLHPRTAMEVLIGKSLIKINQDSYLSGVEYIWMHDQLRDLGRKIISQKSKGVAGDSRLWNGEEALDIVRLKKKNDKVEALVLANLFDKPFVTDEELENFPNLRFLELRRGTFVGNFKNHISKLICIHWDSPPLIYKPTNFYLKELVHFELSNCEATEDWTGWNLLKVVNKIKVVVLQRCTKLTRTPDFSGCICLERLSLRECSNLQVIEISSDMKALRDLDIKWCDSLKMIVGLSNCKNVKSIFFRGCNGLEKIEIPSNSESLRDFDIKWCDSLKTISSLSNCRNLNTISIHACNKLEEIEISGNMESLRNFDIRWCDTLKMISGLPDCKNLNTISIHACNKLERIEISGNMESLRDFDIKWCDTLRMISGLRDCKNLDTISIHACNKLEGIEISGNMDSLRNFCIKWCDTLKMISGLPDCKKLNKLSIHACNNLEGIEIFGNMESLQNLDIKWCDTLKMIGGLRDCKNLNTISIHACNKLEGIEISSNMESLRDFDVKWCDTLENICGLSNCKNLNSITIHSCNKLQEIEISGNMESLRSFDIKWCDSLKKICGLSNYKNLNSIFIHSCNKLKDIDIFSLESLKDFDIRWCDSLGSIYDLSKCENINYISTRSCNEP